MMSAKREELIDRMIRIYGFEHEAVITFISVCCENDFFSDEVLEIVVQQHEAHPWVA